MNPLDQYILRHIDLKKYSHKTSPPRQTGKALKQEMLVIHALSESDQAIFPEIFDSIVRPGQMSHAFIAAMPYDTNNLEIQEISGIGPEQLESFLLFLDRISRERNPLERKRLWSRENRIILVRDFKENPMIRLSNGHPSVDGQKLPRVIHITKNGIHSTVMGVFHPEKEAFDGKIDLILGEMAREIPFTPDRFNQEEHHPAVLQKSVSRKNPFRTYFDNTLVGMAVLSPDAQFLEINNSFCQMTGYRKKAFLDLKWDDLIHPEDHEQKSWREFFRSLKEGIDCMLKNKRLIRKNGEAILVRIVMKAIKTVSGETDCFLLNIEDVTEKKKSQEAVWRQANFDMLTGLPNRFMFFDRLKEEIQRSQREGASFALFFIDLDRFKEVNDTLGHQMGDTLLIETASRISHCIRKSDTASRFGGDEFTLILSRIPSTAHIEEVARKILDALSAPFTLGGGKQKSTILISGSIGITVYPTNGFDAKTLLENADQAMYVAKNGGRNRFSYFTPALQKEALARLDFLNELKDALVLSEFRLYFQPVLDLKTGKIVKAEALLRWLHPRLGVLCPSEFITITEESGLICEIGRFVFREAGRWAKRWAEIAPESFQISVNMSSVQFENNRQLVEESIKCLESLGLPGENLSIEITENLLLNINENVAQKLLGFARKGISLSIDNFGTGCFTLSYLLKFHIDYLKIDESFIRNLENDVEKLAMAEATIMMAHKLGLKVIAKGVETSAQKNILSSIHCDYGQGFLFSKPLSPPEFELFLHQFS